MLKNNGIIYRLLAIVMLVLSGCGGGGGGEPAPPETYTIGGTVTGLAGSGLQLQNNGGDNLDINANGDFSFATALADGSDYAVTVSTQPTSLNQTCTVSNDSSTVAGANVSNIAILCVTNTYTIGGNVTGLAGSGLQLQNNGGDSLDISANGDFSFASALADGSDYVVTVSNQPTSLNQTCTVSNDSSTIAGANVSNIAILCVTNTYTIGGNVTGLAGSGLVLQNNSGDDLTITENGDFSFNTAVVDGTAYAVTVLTQPGNLSQTCTVNNDSGDIAGSNITNVAISCVTNSFTVGGSVSGLAGSGLVLQNNNGDDLTIASDGDFIFTTTLLDGTSYSVSVATQPTGPAQYCSVTNGGGQLAGNHINNVSVTCVTDTHTVGGTVTGLQAAGLVLRNNGGDELVVDGDGGFTFAIPLEPGSDYLVTVKATPDDPNHACYATQNRGTVTSADITDVIITCQSLAGHFIEPMATLDATAAIAAGDLNGDGDADMVVANNVSGGAPNTVWFNDGKGGYTDSGQTLGNGRAYDMALGDIDNDGDLDFVVANFGGTDSKLWLNDGSGQFSDSLQVLGGNWTAVAIGDVDGDHDLDIIAGFYGANQVFLNDSNGNFSDDSQPLGGSQTLDMALGDLNGDGDLDLVAANYQQADRVWFNDAGEFSDSGQSFTSDFNYTYNVALGDINNDGYLDMVTAESGDEGNRVRLNDGSGVFTEDQSLGNGRTRDIALGDLDGDGDLDLVEGISNNKVPNAVWINNSGVFIDSGQWLGSNSYAKSTHAVALTDADGDGDLDMLAGNSGQANTLALNNGAGLLSLLGQRLGGNGTSKYLLFADLDGDGDVERIARSLVFNNDGAGNYLPTGNNISCYNPYSAVTVDVNADDDLDIVVGCYNVASIFINDGNGDFTESTETLVQGGSAFNADVMVKGDLDSDGDQDVIIGNAIGPSSQPQVNTVWLNNSDGTFTRLADIPAGYTTGLALGDIDGDMDLDIVEVVGYGDPARVWLGNGDGSFAASAETLPTSSATSIAMGDINGDGHLDIVIGNDGAATDVYLNLGTGVFSPAAQILTDNATRSIDLGDLDNDGDVDLVMGNFSSQATRLFLNDGSGDFSPHLDLGGSDTNVVKLVDVDGDGDLDIGTGNNGGLDTIYFNQTR